jgi:hypothetical protein
MRKAQETQPRARPQRTHLFAGDAEHRRNPPRSHGTLGQRGKDAIAHLGARSQAGAGASAGARIGLDG